MGLENKYKYKFLKQPNIVCEFEVTLIKFLVFTHLLFSNNLSSVDIWNEIKLNCCVFDWKIVPLMLSFTVLRNTCAWQKYKCLANLQILNISNFVWIVIELFLFLHWVSIFSTQQSVFRKFRIFISVAVKRSNVSCVLWIWRFSRYGSLTNILKRKLWNLKQSKKDAKIKIDYLVFTVGKFKGSSWGIYCSTIQC